MSETVSPNRISYSREFIMNYSHHVKPEPFILDKLKPYLSPPVKQSKKQFQQRNPGSDTLPRFGTEKTKSKTPNPRKIDVVPPVQAQSEKKNFGRSKDATFSPTQFKQKLNQDQKENVPSNLNIPPNNNSKPIHPLKSPRTTFVKQEPLRSVENASSSPARKNRTPGTNKVPARTPLKPVFTKKAAEPISDSSILISPRAVSETPIVTLTSSPSAPSVNLITDEAPQEVTKTPVSSPLIKTPMVRFASPTHSLTVVETAFVSPSSKDIPPSGTPTSLSKIQRKSPFKSPQSGIKISPGKSPKSPNRPISPLDEQRLLQRQKQIDYGYRTVGYLRYRLLVAKDQRKPDHPRTPKKTQGCSKRSWDGQLKKWRRDLHLWDPDNVDAFRALLNSDLVVSIISVNPELDEIVKIVREKMDNPTANATADDDDVTSPSSPPPSQDASSIPSEGFDGSIPDGVNEKKVSPSRINEPRLQKVARTLVF